MLYLEMKIAAPDLDVLKSTFFWLKDNLVTHDFSEKSSMAGGGGGVHQSTFQLQVSRFSYAAPPIFAEPPLSQEELKRLRILLARG